MLTRISQKVKYQFCPTKISHLRRLNDHELFAFCFLQMDCAVVDLEHEGYLLNT